ncbi:hypothetical protein ATANTOWER_031301 [Ataeniobius toweri]|uniref:Uncharacterized protein n=1 Tax=Ataeniobius toweri TaxID=208326 RepID=A0ABU7A8Q8_9TELE|nr:hypothetical protein [Ataeniobius toweri]
MIGNTQHTSRNITTDTVSNVNPVFTANAPQLPNISSRVFHDQLSLPAFSFISSFNLRSLTIMALKVPLCSWGCMCNIDCQTCDKHPPYLLKSNLKLACFAMPFYLSHAIGHLKP